MSEKKRGKHSEQWLAILIRLLARLPLPMLYLIADTLFILAFYLLRYQRKLVENNLQSAFPEHSPIAIRQLAASSYRNTAHMLLESIKGGTLTTEDLARRVEMENPEVIYTLLEQYPTVVTVAAHHGNWEWMQLACSSRLAVPLAALYKPLNHPGIDIPLQESRSRFGSLLIEAKQALPELLKFARQPGIIALVADQGPRPDEEKHWARFLGQDTAFYPGPEKLARLLKAPLVFVHMERLRRGYYRIKFEVLLKPPYRQDPGAIMDTYIKAVERQVLKAPQDWVWMYKRWKYQRSMYE
jgi:KDO2-lipid IV(A) lauroyltransferase